MAEEQVIEKTVKSTEEGHEQNVLTAAKGGSITFVGRFAAHIINLGFAYLMARMLGASDYGLYKLMMLVATLSGAISMVGMNGGLKRFIAIANKKGDNDRIWGYIQLGVGIPFLVGILICSIVLIAAGPIANGIFSKPDLEPLLRIGALAIPFLVISNSMVAIALGFKRVDYETYSKDLAFNIVKLGLAVGAILVGFGVFGVAVAYVIAAVVAAIMLLNFIPRIFSFKRPISSAVRETKEMLTFSVPLWFSQLLNQFGRRFETLILGVYGLSANVGVFTVILAISQVANLGYTALRNISNPIISELYSQNKIEELRKFYQTVTKWALSFNLPFFLTIVILGENILTLFDSGTSNDFSSGYLGMVILAIGTLVNASTGACGALINMTGYSKVSFYNSIVYLAATLALDFTLIPTYNVVGAAMAGALTIVIVNSIRLVEVYYLVHKLLPFNWSFLKPISAALIAGAGTYLLKDFVFPDHNLLQLITLLIILWGAYAGLLILFKLSPEDKMIVNKVLKKKDKRKKKKLKNKNKN